MSNYCKLDKNSDHEYECHGCQIIGNMFKGYESNIAGRASVTCKFHNSFPELEDCAQKGCATCRVFQRAFWLRQITKREADRLGDRDQKDLVWARLKPKQAITGTTAGQSNQTFLEIGIGNPPQERMKAKVLCTLEQSRRPVNLSAKNTNDAIVEEAKQWLKACNDPGGSHTQCKNFGWSLCNPSNLIEIKSGARDVKLVKTFGTALVPYVALSYCWGTHLAKSPAEKNQVKFHETTKDLRDADGKVIVVNGGNLKERRDWFSTSQLPATIRDVIKLTWNLGIRYIWIDAMCIEANWNDEASKMHEVYGNAHVTLAICSSERTTDGLLPTRQAWQHRRNACRLHSGQWLSNLDMSLNEIRLHSPPSTRAWTLQEERLSPRIIYVSGQRMYWSCSHSQHTEMGCHSPQQLLESPDTFQWMELPQAFLAIHRNQNETVLHKQWQELVKVYVKRDMTNETDRFLAISGLAVKYISLYEESGSVKKEEYLAGLWRQRFAQGLAWSVEVAKPPSQNLWSVAPRWSWASLPLCSDIIVQLLFEPVSEFELLEPSRLGKSGQCDEPLEVVKRGASVKCVKVRGPIRRLLQEGSVRKDWEIIQAKNGQKDVFDFSSCINEPVHSRNLNTGRIVASEPHKQEIVGQLDYLFSENEICPRHIFSDGDMKSMDCLQIGKSSMLLLMKDAAADGEFLEEGELICTYRRVGICNNVRQMFFALAERKTLVLS